jgi:hypothetical protein
MIPLPYVNVEGLVQPFPVEALQPLKWAGRLPSLFPYGITAKYPIIS